MLYTGKQINEILGAEPSTWASKGQDLINRAKRAGLEIELAQANPGRPSLYRIVKDNFHIEGEIWTRSIYDSAYEVSSFGRYRNYTNKKLISGKKTPDGYIRTSLKKGTNDYTSIAMHRIVFFSFHPELYPEQQYWTIDHIDGRRDNNHLDNLRPMTIAQNVEAKTINREKPQEILTQIILKFGYEETIKQLQYLLNKGE